jgi:hypothetical protein
MKRNMFRYGDDKRALGSYGFFDGGGGVGSGNIDCCGVWLKLIHHGTHWWQEWEPEMFAGMARADAANNLGAILDGLLRVECGLLARKALKHNSSIFVDLEILDSVFVWM